jgi:hypothetical protein
VAQEFVLSFSYNVYHYIRISEYGRKGNFYLDRADYNICICMYETFIMALISLKLELPPGKEDIPVCIYPIPVDSGGGKCVCSPVE